MQWRPNFFTTKYGELWNESKDSCQRVVQTSHVWLVNSLANSDEWFHPRDLLLTNGTWRFALVENVLGGTLDFVQVHVHPDLDNLFAQIPLS
mmetsp:Transcript_19755/g.38678  ORF Transcript_19755/g.38678 Transcript_19755/m.38678 type:complete len:92 (+) Transcript_19755:231-506(+)